MQSRLRKCASVAAISALGVAVLWGLCRWADIRARYQDELDHTMVEAVYQNDAREVRRLLALGANPNEPDTYPKLSSVTRYLNRLLNHETGPEAGILPLFAAFSDPHSDSATFSNGDVVKALLEYGGDPNARNSYNETPLMLACRHGNNRSIRALAENGADVNARDNYKTTPLLLAVNVRDPQPIKSLIEHGADVNEVDSSGDTPLMCAILYYNKPFAEIMIRAHCDVNRRSSSGDTALSMARRNGSEKIARMLIRAGAR